MRTCFESANVFRYTLENCWTTAVNSLSVRSSVGKWSKRKSELYTYIIHQPVLRDFARMTKEDGSGCDGGLLFIARGYKATKTFLWCQHDTQLRNLFMTNEEVSMHIRNLRNTRKWYQYSEQNEPPLILVERASFVVNNIMCVYCYYSAMHMWMLWMDTPKPALVEATYYTKDLGIQAWLTTCLVVRSTCFVYSILCLNFTRTLISVDCLLGKWRGLFVNTSKIVFEGQLKDDSSVYTAVGNVMENLICLHHSPFAHSACRR